MPERMLLTDIGIIGNGVAGNLAAAYFCKSLPEPSVTLVGSADPRRPIVGEALVEVSTHFIREIGLDPLLIEHHYPKYGLTYYCKTKPEDPTDRTYIVDEMPHAPPFPSFLINRFGFDRDLRAHNAAGGTIFRPGRAVAITLGGGAETHRIRIESEAGGWAQEMRCRWLIDAIGRNRLLGRMLQLHERPPI
jgi:flavin-dependent dehydrogenase